MNITEEVAFSKEGHIERFPLIRKLFLALVIVLVASLSFGIGRLTSMAGGKEPIRIEHDTSLTNTQTPATNQTASALNAVSNTQVVGSKNSDKYHHMSCPGAKQIAEKNRVVFTSASAAEASGYTLAANCKNQ